MKSVKDKSKWRLKKEMITALCKAIPAAELCKQSKILFFIHLKPGLTIFGNTTIQLLFLRIVK